MTTANDIVLRPRFKIDLQQHNEIILKAFEKTKTTQKAFIVSRIDDHIFIKYPKHKQHFWSPQLHLEINEVDEHSCIIHGLFGPSPTIWTLFMFLHFMVAGLFIAFAIWAYTNFSLKNSYAIQVSLMLLMVIVWFVLYFAGSIGKTSSKTEMHELNNFMKTIINEKKL